MISLIHRINKAHKITNEEYVFKSISEKKCKLTPKSPEHASFWSGPVHHGVNCLKSNCLLCSVFLDITLAWPSGFVSISSVSMVSMTWWLLQLTVDLVSLLLTAILEINYHCFNELILKFHCLKVKKNILITVEKLILKV